MYRDACCCQRACQGWRKSPHLFHETGTRVPLAAPGAAALSKRFDASCRRCHALLGARVAARVGREDGQFTFCPFLKLVLLQTWPMCDDMQVTATQQAAAWGGNAGSFGEASFDMDA